MALKITIAQINPTIGDINGNLQLMHDAALKAYLDGSKIVIFPELSLTGYSPGDMLDEREFIDRVNKGLATIATLSKATPGLHWVVGAPTVRTGPGKPLENSLVVMLNGKVVLQYAKQLLPTYGVFDERRYFEPGPAVAKTLMIDGVNIGFMICEDGWNDEQQDYAINPFVQIAEAAADLVISINASPSNIGKYRQRLSVFEAASRRHNLPLVYVNQIGGHDQLIYDGASFAMTPGKGLVFEAERFTSSLTNMEFSDGEFYGPDSKKLESAFPCTLEPMEFYRRQIILGLRDYARRCGFTKAVVGSSGGIDSALTLALAVEALGANNVSAITMPSRYSSPGSIKDSEELCKNLGIRLNKHPINKLVGLYVSDFEQAFGYPLIGLALENLQARIRGTILMENSNSYGNLLLTTGNKSEISVGYCTLYGDTNGGLGLIGDLYKTEVFELSRHINREARYEIIPQAIIDKAPSAELAPGQRDEDTLPPYDVLDTILKVIIEASRLSDDEKPQVEKAYTEIAASQGGKETIAKVQKMISRNEYKRRQAPPILRLRGKAFGNGRQMPIAAKYD